MKGLLEAIDQDALIESLTRRGYTVTSVLERSETPGYSAALNWLLKVDRRELIDLYLSIGTMLKSGIPLTVSLIDVAASSDNPRVASALTAVSRRIEAGSTLSAALRSQPIVFPSLACDLIEAAESIGRLDEVFLRLASYADRDMQTMDQIKSALQYPAFVFAAAVAVVVATLVFVLPNFAAVFGRMDAELPLPTRVILQAGDWIHTYMNALLLGVAGLGITTLWLSGKEAVAARLEDARMKIPAVGRLERHLAIGRFARTLGLLLSGGVPILQALPTSARVTGNRRMRAAIEAAAESIRQGSTLTESLAASGQFPRPVMRIIEVGEKTSRLDDLLQTLSDQFDRQILYKVKRLTTFLEVTMIIGVGGLVALIAFALLMPMAAVLDLL
ncbi:MAG: type II secretion system F family protein [Deltaproteobacteria bacterium]|nr:type II secretion system F family protein [Deltaproteobacteria bacterium]